jgi:hypothetical protein
MHPPSQSLRRDRLQTYEDNPSAISPLSPLGPLRPLPSTNTAPLRELSFALTLRLDRYAPQSLSRGSARTRVETVALTATPPQRAPPPLDPMYAHRPKTHAKTTPAPPLFLTALQIPNLGHCLKPLAPQPCAARYARMTNSNSQYPRAARHRNRPRPRPRNRACAIPQEPAPFAHSPIRPFAHSAIGYWLSAKRSPFTSRATSHPG